jgi:hypothetical protein
MGLFLKGAAANNATARTQRNQRKVLPPWWNVVAINQGAVWYRLYGQMGIINGSEHDRTALKRGFEHDMLGTCTFETLYSEYKEFWVV